MIVDCSERETEREREREEREREKEREREREREERFLTLSIYKGWKLYTRIWVEGGRRGVES